MDHNISSVIAMITPGILELLMKERALSLEDACNILYNSRLYRTLEDPKAKLWGLSYTVLYDMLIEELTTGNITFPEEQIG